MAEDDRPREKLESLGRQNLSDAELLAIILGSGNRSETAVQLAQRMLADHQGLSNLARLGLNDFKKYKGVGTAKAVTIAAAFELGRRRQDINTNDKIKITTSRSAYQLLKRRLSDLPHEEFWILSLNRANQVVKEEHLSKGGISGTVVDIRLVCKSAIENNASSIVVAHNHPSGEVQPSEQDKSITTKLRDGLKLFGITLIDHIIVGDNKYFSFSDEGLI